MKRYLKDLTLPELTAYMEAMGEKPFRARQLFVWMYRWQASAFSEMTDISLTLRDRLETDCLLTALSIQRVLCSQKDGTRKYVLKTPDGHLIESVFMKYRFGNSLCVSSQAGCRMGCAFCASGLNGLARNLTPGEMTDQLLIASRDTREEIRHIVVMGTGEPMDNYEHLLKFLTNITEPRGIGLGRRQITVSTCGLIPQMERFLADLPQANLAISLHAPDDALRNLIMPIGKTYTVESLICFARKYTEQSGRKITFEYALIKGLNDTAACAEKLAACLKGLNCLVNLIPLNAVDETGLRSPERAKAEMFKGVLEGKDIQATIRRELGTDIAAACGQLRLAEQASLAAGQDETPADTRL
jgi:23S rRNA (adenine2503-C2)-methyltransferase